MNLFGSFLRIQNQLRVFHWQSHTYTQHKALGKTYEEFDSLIDQFVEVAMGKYGKRNNDIIFNIEIINNINQLDTFLKDTLQFLKDITQHLEEDDTDLLNIRDEMLALFHRLAYLLTLT
jgi:hypothetical protein